MGNSLKKSNIVVQTEIKSNETYPKNDDNIIVEKEIKTYNIETYPKIDDNIIIEIETRSDTCNVVEIENIIDHEKKRTKLCKAKVIEIKKLLKEGKFTVKEIASKYHVRPVTIDHIDKGKTWAHITV